LGAGAEYTFSVLDSEENTIASGNAIVMFAF